ncbi:MAG: hypothetical protein ACFE0P_10440 [Oceanicaulis sp.]
MSETGRDPRSTRSELLEDTLGFNLRSLRTLADLWIRPRKVMDAVVLRDRVSYTPMVRLFLALIGVQIAVSVLWGGYGSMIQDAIAAQMSEAQLSAYFETMGTTPDAFFSMYGNIASALHAPIVGAFTALSVFVLGAFGAKRAFAVNLNLVFATLTAGSVIGIAFLSVNIFGQTTPTWSVAVIGAAYFITWLRGLPEHIASTRSGRIVKSAVLALTMIALVMIGGVVMHTLTAVFTVLMV